MTEINLCGYEVKNSKISNIDVVGIKMFKKDQEGNIQKSREIKIPYPNNLDMFCNAMDNSLNVLLKEFFNDN